MNSGRSLENVDNFIRRNTAFGGVDGFEQSFEAIRQRLRQVAAIIAKTLQYILQPHQIQQGHPTKRFFAELDSHQAFWVKSAFSIADKIRRDHCEDNPAKKHGYTFDNFLHRMNDIIRFRIVCNFLTDVDAVTAIFCRELPAQGVQIVTGPTDRIRIEPEQRKRGHRAIHFECRSPAIGEERYPFELQIMTLLQYAWDKKDHFLIYRRERSGIEVPLEHRMSIFAASEMLYVADEHLDTLRRRMEREEQRP